MGHVGVAVAAAAPAAFREEETGGRHLVEPPSASAIFVRALFKRCPWCGNRKIFRHWLRILDRCPRCGLRFDREEGAWLMSITINYGITGLLWVVLFVVALVLYLPHVNGVVLAAASVAEIVVVAVFTYPFSKTITAAADLLVHNAHKGLTPEMAKRFGLTEEMM